MSRPTIDQLTGADLPPTLDLPALPVVGTQIRYVGDYELLAEIARGGMGVVYRARQRSLNRIVALKMILAGEFASVTQRERFRTEAQAAAALQHPNIVTVYEVGEFDERPYFSMEFIPGLSLADKLQAGPLPAPLAAEWVQLLAAAVQQAHAAGIIHRDLKPANILLAVPSAGAAVVPKVTDFGLAKPQCSAPGLTVTGTIVGTPSYMPPEQANGLPTTHVADVYGLGAILYHCLTGRPPFQAESLLATLEQVRSAEVVPVRLLNPNVPPELETICLKCLQKSPDERYGTAQALADDLRRYLTGEPIQAVPPRLGYLLQLMARRNLFASRLLPLVSVGTMALCLLICLLDCYAISAMARRILEVYAHFPSAEQPTALWHWIAAVESATLFTLIASVVCLGTSLVWLAVFVARPQTVWQDWTRGLAIGWYVNCFFAIGASVVMACILGYGMLPIIPDIQVLEANINPTKLVARYPDLAHVPIDERGQLAVELVCSRLLLGILEGGAIGAIFTGLFLLTCSVGMVVIYGHIERHRSNSIHHFIAEALPTLMPVMTLHVVYVEQVLLKAGGLRLWLIGLLAVVSFIGGIRRWSWRVQVLLFGLWLFFIMLREGLGEPIYWLNLALGLLVLVWWLNSRAAPVGTISAAAAGQPLTSAATKSQHE